MVLGLSLLTVLLVAVPVAAHDPDELEEWVAEWESRTTNCLALRLCPAFLAEYDDMANRHPRFFGRPVPVTTPAVRQTAAGEPSVGAESAGVEQWRPLVAAYFPDNTDQMLCIMSHESRGVASARNRSSTATGLFQILASLWGPHFGVTRTELEDPETNVRIARAVYDMQGIRAWVVWRQCP